jgi:mercuric ion transport protein
MVGFLSVCSVEVSVAIRDGSADGNQMDTSGMGNSRVERLLDLLASIKPSSTLATQALKDKRRQPMANTCCEDMRNANNSCATGEIDAIQLGVGEKPVVPTATELAKAVVAEAVSMLGWDSAQLDHKAETVRRYILEQYPHLGRAPTRQEIIAALKFEHAGELQGILERLHELDFLYLNSEEQEVRLAYPFSSVPTRHLVSFPDWAEAKPVSAQCAVDALGIPFMLRRDVSIASSCAHCDRSLAMQVQNGTIVTDHPTKTVVWAGTTRTGPVATCVCPTINFFCSTDHAITWRQTQQDAAGHVLSLGEALYVGKEIFGAQLTDRACSAPSTPRHVPGSKNQKGTITATSVSGVVAAFLASLCCIGPLVLVALGAGVGATGFWAGTAGFLKALLPYRPWFIGTAGLCFAASFYLVYRKPADVCESGAPCQPEVPMRFMRRLLWLLAILALVFITAPYWLGL